MFIGYHSIENSYRNKEIAMWIERFPELEGEEFILQEKIHGSNVQWMFDKNGTFSLGKRSGMIGEGENFFNIQNETSSKYMDVISVLRNFAVGSKSNLNVYGEWFGEGIQKGVNYGKGKRIMFFDVRVDGTLLPTVAMEDFFSELNIEDMMVPNFGVVTTIKEATEFPTRKVTLINPDGGSIIEGIVIKPYNKVYVYGHDVFMLKKKNEEFKEEASKPKVPREPLSDNVIFLSEEFKKYTNENRVMSIFSKYGEIEKPEQIGDYIRLVITDAKEDFLKDYQENIDALSKSEQKKVFAAGSKEIVVILNKFL